MSDDIVCCLDEIYLVYTCFMDCFSLLNQFDIRESEIHES